MSNFLRTVSVLVFGNVNKTWFTWNGGYGRYSRIHVSELKINDRRGRGAGSLLQKPTRHEVNISPFVVLSRTEKLHFSRSREVDLVYLLYENMPSQFQTFLSRRARYN